MTWFKVDDKLHSHPKVEQAGVAAMGLWVIAGSWSADQLTDGVVSVERISRLCGDRRQAHLLARSLVRAGLWVEVEGGFKFHEWHEHQPTAEAVKAEKERKRRNVADHRARRRQEVTAPVTGYSTGNESGLKSRPDPDPTRPDPRREEDREGAQGATAPPAAAPTPKVEPAKVKPPKATRGTRCPSSVDLLAADWCARHGLPLPVQDPEVGRMLDYFASAPGTRGVKVDWAATWRNWSRRASEFARPGVNGTKTRTQLGLQPLVVGEYDGGGYVDT